MVPSIQQQINSFRVKELTECCERLGIRRNGRKGDLQQRLLALFADSTDMAQQGYLVQDHARIEHARRIVEDVYRYQHGLAAVQPPGGTAVLYTSQALPVAGNQAAQPRQQQFATQPLPSQANAADVRQQHSRQPQPQRRTGPAPTQYPVGFGELIGADLSGSLSRPAAEPNTVISCCCGNDQEQRSMVQCEAAGCGVWQHRDCLGHPVTARVEHHFCERCRAARADPFWEPFDQGLLQPVRLRPTGRALQVGHGAQDQQMAERSFELGAAQLALVKKKSQDYRLQVMCLQLNDSVPFRFHWPLQCELRINGMAYRVYARNSATKLGANGRDEPALIGGMCLQGKNRLVVTVADSAPYVVLLQLVRQRSMQQVKAMMLLPLTLEDALARVRAQLAAHEDEELETVHSALSLRCPLSGVRIRTPARFVDTDGLAAFDLDTFLSSAQRTRKWQCPHSMKHSCVQRLQVDTYMQHILRAVEPYPDITEVEVSPEGRWRPSGSSEDWVDIRDIYHRSTAPGLRMKSEPGVGGSGDPGPGPTSLVEDDDDSEEDEMEELRRAARDVVANNKRVRAAEVIDLVSDSDEEVAQPPPKRRAVISNPSTANGPPQLSQQQQQRLDHHRQPPVQHPLQPQQHPSAASTAYHHQQQQQQRQQLSPLASPTTVPALPSIAGGNGRTTIVISRPLPRANAASPDATAPTSALPRLGLSTAAVGPSGSGRAAAVQSPGAHLAEQQADSDPLYRALEMLLGPQGDQQANAPAGAVATAVPAAHHGTGENGHVSQRSSHVYEPPQQQQQQQQQRHFYGSGPNSPPYDPRFPTVNAAVTSSTLDRVLGMVPGGGHWVHTVGSMAPPQQQLQQQQVPQQHYMRSSYPSDVSQSLPSIPSHGINLATSLAPSSAAAAAIAGDSARNNPVFYSAPLPQPELRSWRQDDMSGSRQVAAATAGPTGAAAFGMPQYQEAFSSRQPPHMQLQQQRQLPTARPISANCNHQRTVSSSGPGGTNGRSTFLEPQRSATRSSFLPSRDTVELLSSDSTIHTDST